MAGRPKKVLSQEDADKIVQLASTGLGILDICRSLGISWDVFNRERNDKKYIKDALKKGQALGLAKVSSALFENATKKGNVVSQIFYLKNRAPDLWNDRNTQEININLKEVLDSAKSRLSQHNHNEEIIEGEILIDKELLDKDRLATNKTDTKDSKEMQNE